MSTAALNPSRSSTNPSPGRLRARQAVAVATATAMLLVLTPTLAAADSDAPPPEIVTDEIERFVPQSVEDGAEVSEVAESPIAFTMIGFQAPEEATLEARVHDGEWTNWFGLEFLDDEDGPDASSDEGRAKRQDAGRRFTEPVWVGEATRVQVRITGAPLASVRASVVDGDGVSRSLFRRVADSFRPRIAGEPAEASSPLGVISRREWGADESKRNGESKYASKVHFAVVHHTAHTSGSTANTYSESQAPAIMRSMYGYHTDALGWADLGYNVVIDRFGRIYEGRNGGLARGVIGAHARGFNTGSVGVAIMGNFETQQPSSAARQALTDVLAWQFRVHGLNVRTQAPGLGGSKYNSPSAVPEGSIIGHRDAGWTACPGAAFYSTFGSLRSEVASKLAANPAPPRHSFPDVSTSRYYDRPVSWLSAHEITNGFGNTGLFKPDETVTRGQMAAFVWRTAGSPEGNPAHGFPDVPKGRYYDEAVRWMKASGITDGYGNTGRFEPDLPVTRGEMAAFLWRYVGEPAGDPHHRFSDVSPSRFYDTAVRWLRAHGITEGAGGGDSYVPGRSITRGEMAAMLWRLGATPPAWRSAPATSPYTVF